MQVGQRGLFAGFEDSTALKIAAAASENDRQVFVIMFIAITNAAAEDDHRAIQQALMIFGSRFHFLQKPRKFSSVKRIDFRDHFELTLIVLMVRQIVMSFVDPDFGKGAI